jgi:hypothetical protein
MTLLDVEDRADMERMVRRLLTADVERIADHAVFPYMREVATAELKRRETVEVAHYPHRAEDPS